MVSSRATSAVRRLIVGEGEERVEGATLAQPLADCRSEPRRLALASFGLSFELLHVRELFAMSDGARGLSRERKAALALAKALLEVGRAGGRSAVLCKDARLYYGQR